MPSVRCPSCKHLLNVRDEMIGRERALPAVRRRLPRRAGGRPGGAVPAAARRPGPVQPWRPAGGRRDDDPVPTYPGPRRDGEGRPADPLRRAGNWLFGLSIIALVWGMTCGCGGACALLDRGPPAPVVDYILASAFLLQLIFHVAHPDRRPVDAAPAPATAACAGPASCWR